MSLFKKGQHVLYIGHNLGVRHTYATVNEDTIVYEQTTVVRITFISDGFNYGAWALNLKRLTKEEFAVALAKQALGVK